MFLYDRAAERGGRVELGVIIFWRLERIPSLIGSVIVRCVVLRNETIVRLQARRFDLGTEFAVELVRTGLRYNRDNAAAGSAVLGFKTARFDLNFFNEGGRDIVP